MASDRTVPPDSRRLRLAHRAGLRPRPRWVITGLLCLAIASSWEHASTAGQAAWRSLWHRQVVMPAGFDRGELESVALTWGIGLAAVAAVIALGMFLGGGLGPIDRQALGRLRPRPVRLPPLGIAAVVVVSVGLLVVALGPVAAGAARAVDASPDALAELWQIWLVRGLAITGGVLLIAGAAETLLLRHGIRRALYSTVEEAREDRRRAGSGRG